MKTLFLSFAPPEKWRDERSRDIKSDKWQIFRKKILERDNYTFAYCSYKSAKYQIIDHIDGNPENQKNDVPLHLKRWSLKRHSFLGCSRNHHTLKGVVFCQVP